MPWMPWMFDVELILDAQLVLAQPGDPSWHRSGSRCWPGHSVSHGHFVRECPGGWPPLRSVAPPGHCALLPPPPPTHPRITEDTAACQNTSQWLHLGPASGAIIQQSLLPDDTKISSSWSLPDSIKVTLKAAHKEDKQPESVSAPII